MATEINFFFLLQLMTVRTCQLTVDTHNSRYRVEQSYSQFKDDILSACRFPQLLLFLDRNSSYKSVTTQILHDAFWLLNPYTCQPPPPFPRIKLELNYCIVLYCIDGVVIAAIMHFDLFEIYCAPPNLD